LLKHHRAILEVVEGNLLYIFAIQSFRSLDWKFQVLANQTVLLWIVSAHHDAGRALTLQSAPAPRRTRRSRRDRDRRSVGRTPRSISPTMRGSRTRRPVARHCPPVRPFSPCYARLPKYDLCTTRLMSGHPSWRRRGFSLSPRTCLFKELCLLLVRTQAPSPASLPLSRAPPCARPLGRRTIPAPQPSHPRALVVTCGLAPPVFPPGLSPQRPPVPSTAEPTHRHPVHPTSGHKLARGKPLTFLHPSPTLPGALLTGIWPKPPPAMPQGPHCKPERISRVFCANQGHICKESKVPRDLGVKLYLE
jgi:hypothetical protein